MTILLIVLALAAWGAVRTLRELPRDGYRAIRTDPRRLP